MKTSHLCILSMAAAVLACSDPSGPVAPQLPPSKILNGLSLNVGAAISAVGDTLDLSAVAISLSGDTIAIPPGELEWGVSDASMLHVNQDGRVHILKASDGNIVYPWARWTSYGITAADSAYVVITPTREPVAKLKIRPQGDSIKTALPESGACCGVSIFALNVAGDSLGLIRAPLLGDGSLSQMELIISYMGPAFASLGFGQYLVGVRKLGPFWLHTEALVYGTLLRDSIQMLGVYPSNAMVAIKPDPITSEISSVTNGHSKVIQPCGAIMFQNQMASPIEIIFEDTTMVSGCVPGDPTGNIPSIPRFGHAERKIPAGTVRWTARIKDSPPSSPTVSGTVITKELE